MARHIQTITADGSTLLQNVVLRANAQSYAATIFVQGTFGSGTLTVQVSGDGGTTKMTAADVNGVDISFNANGYASIVLGGGADGLAVTPLKIYATLAGATNPNLSVITYDNL